MDARGIDMDTLFDEIQPQSRSRQIVEKIRGAIEGGTLRQGDKLPPERDLCVQLGVSRTSLREAMRILEAYGVVEPTRGGGTYVTDKFSENVFEFLGFGKKLSRQNFKYLLNARKILEVGAVEQALGPDGAAQTGGGPDPRSLESLVDEQTKEEDFARLGALDARFHEQLVAMSRNPILAAFYRMIHAILLQGTTQVIAYPPSRRIVLHDHRKIARAFVGRDRKACVRAVCDHLKKTETLIEKYLPKED
ncbi:MAG: FadR family transcriptional regulator [Spirochaetia bacterium]|jgi:DNA-binding FadR family transcriptional regulator|nr:FadR family transcriptional regulator [Spirochaetia bacterium]